MNDAERANELRFRALEFMERGGSEEAARDWLRIHGVLGLHGLPPREPELEAVHEEEWGDSAEEAHRRYVSTFDKDLRAAEERTKRLGAGHHRKPPEMWKDEPPNTGPAYYTGGPIRQAYPHDCETPRPEGRRNCSREWITRPKGDTKEAALERFYLGYENPFAVVDLHHGRRKPARNRFRWTKEDGSV